MSMSRSSIQFAMRENWYKNISEDLNFLFYIMTDVFDTDWMVGYL